jgi:hypothetical protein
MKFKHPFRGVLAGEIYPTDFSPGQECPPELLDAAIACDVVEQSEPEETKPKRKKAEA